MNGESSVEVREGSFAFEKGSLQPENRSSPVPSPINWWKATEAHRNSAGVEWGMTETGGVE